MGFGEEVSGGNCWLESEDAYWGVLKDLGKEGGGRKGCEGWLWD